MASCASRRPLTAFRWGVKSVAGRDTQLTALAAAAAGQQLVIPPAQVALLPAGLYTFNLTVTNWLGCARSRLLVPPAAPATCCWRAY